MGLLFHLLCQLTINGQFGFVIILVVDRTVNVHELVVLGRYVPVINRLCGILVW